MVHGRHVLAKLGVNPTVLGAHVQEALGGPLVDLLRCGLVVIATFLEIAQTCSRRETKTKQKTEGMTFECVLTCLLQLLYRVFLSKTRYWMFEQMGCGGFGRESRRIGEVGKGHPPLPSQRVVLVGEFEGLAR